MIITFHRLLGSTIPVQSAVCLAPTRAGIKAARPASTMPASLWRHTQSEDAAEASHHRTAGRTLAGAALLIAGSVAYAICQTGALLSGNTLHDAVAAFLR